MSQQYRPDIDGLRAIAVLSVIIFHAFPSVLPGGLIGVDIFFVISGYLITGLITSDLKADKFTFLEFYLRRVRRIIPILFVVLVSTFSFGWFSLYSDDYALLGKHISAATTFTSNFIYLNESSYFDLDAEAKPLLHLWSLAIEEQFYLVWPILLYFLYVKIKLNSINLIYAILTFAILSLAACFFLTLTNSDYAFYLPFTRFWELSIGGLFVLISREIEIKRKFSILITYTGYALLIFSFILINKNTAFPGAIALVPCLAVGAILIGRSDLKVFELFFYNKFLLFIGLISYSLYLWHWPVLFFLKNINPNPANFTLIAFLILAFLFSLASYYLIETPFRRATVKTPIVTIVILFFILGFIGFNSFQRNGLDFREVNGRLILMKFFKNDSTGEVISKNLNNLDSSLNFTLTLDEGIEIKKLINNLRGDSSELRKLKNDSEEVNSDKLFCSSLSVKTNNCHNVKNIPGEKLNVLVVGDSHAGNFLHSLKIAYPEINFIPFVEGGCVPISQRYKKRDTLCGVAIFGAMKYAETNKVDLLVISSRWVGSFEEIKSDLNFYKKHVKKIALVGPSLTFHKEVFRILADYDFDDSFNKYINKNFERNNIIINDSMRKFSFENKVSYIDKISLYCANKSCKLFNNDKLFIFDKGHMTGSGVSHLAESINRVKVIEKILESNEPILVN